MKYKPTSGLIGVILILTLQWACTIVDTLPDYFCEMNGGTWHPSTQYENAWCEQAKPKEPQNPVSEGQPENQPGESLTEPPIDSQEVPPTEKYLLPTPASAQECNATLYIQTSVEVVEEVKETYYRECDYKLTAINSHPSEGVWVVRRTNTSVYSSATNSDDSYWYSDLLMPGQGWEVQFRSTYYTNGQTSRQGVDKVAGVFNHPECLYLLNSPEVEAISQPVQWACAP